MHSFNRLKNRLIARLITRFPRLARRFINSYRPWESEGQIPWTEPRKPLRDCRLALVTTAGVHHANQPAFDMQDPDGDPSWRELDGATIRHDFRITHDYYDHTDAEKDLNIVLPLDRLQEFIDEGVLGSLNRRHFGFMGHITGRHIPALIEFSAREIADRLRSDAVDLVLLTPA
ncbi:glycine/sarcosine/betaine reductase selenoprotein B [Geothermobacter ehrlichii]|uniref:Glycine/sarcosine/betaine reductase selenoprotein B n=1 Tax=Geothermobacter ehrlichii TaxID=213224 RepID=A0A5D3WHJ8_9BACT|nr:glycine/sarcosine/betaine reductase selenoprotein B family protein [Geothermobacter ehrlichii]TYO95021.1 glycine/sarcosine/betaine reductase selenoprotein B [Geothermobacter ehrlichii]